MRASERAMMFACAAMDITKAIASGEFDQDKDEDIARALFHVLRPHGGKLDWCRDVVAEGRKARREALEVSA